MSTLQKDDLLQKRGQDLYDQSGEKIGKIEEIYLDADTGAPEWALVNTGLFGTKSTFVPLRDATDDEGGNLRVPYEKSRARPPRMGRARSRTPRASIPTVSSPSSRRLSSTATTGSTTQSRALTPDCPK